MNQRTPPRRSRVRRLRKKLYVDEFQVLGFELKLQRQENESADADNAFWNDFLREAIESSGLTYGGADDGFVVPQSRRSATEADRHWVAAWLQSRPDVEHFEVGPLIDATYAPEDVRDLYVPDVVRPYQKLVAGWRKRRGPSN
ncbi:hypothetical protein C7S18_19595 [Ahniella affigens]|uniref:DUF469 domain-containing protein n=1 Tax=Ahniella affigens TaxID=2021234 RepID=A0A2P1PWL5_9GAMM|nr:YggL family protein [Ahniella affigens]AVP99230.1 hypothetical protein C7S18_19595 [Ahniella affigens]